MRRDNAYLQDIPGAALAIRRFTHEISLEDFKSNEEKYEAVNRKFEIIGEAARRFSPEGCNLFPEIPWKRVTAMRNILIHDYDDVDRNMVWETAQRDLPALISHLEKYLGLNPPPDAGWV